MPDPVLADLVLVRGLPGSGKSTRAKQMYVARGYAHVENDMFFVDRGVYRYDIKRIAEANAWCLSQTMRLLATGWRVVVSNTFTRKWEMQSYLTFAEVTGRTHHIEVCTGQWQNVHNVPPEVIENMRARWEP